jgi:outer membrane protein OmpA-like peptidoglycan-associated protein
MMNKLLILVGFTLQFSLLFGQNDCNKNLFTEDEALKLSAYGKKLEASILEKNPADTALIAKMVGDYSKDLCGYTDEEVIKISNYLKELEKQDSINNIPEEVVEIIKEAVDVVDVVNDSIAPKPIVDTKPSNVLGQTVLFNTNSSKPNEINLVDLIKNLKENTKSTVLLVGHTDASGPDNLNLNLSIQRGTAIKRYLISKGIQGSRITVKGEGESKPIADNETEEGKAKNRRVEITVK